jgi:hypothetical protein
VTDPSEKDVVLSVVALVAALGGFVLVFLGVLVSEFQALLSAQAGKRILEGFRYSGYGAFGVFVLSLVTVALGTIWLLSPNRCLYDATVASLFIVLASLACLSAYATFGVLLKG